MIHIKTSLQNQDKYTNTCFVPGIYNEFAWYCGDSLPSLIFVLDAVKKQSMKL